MDLNATIDIIIKDLNEVREIIDDLKRYKGVPAFQIELAKAKCKSVAEVIALLKEFHENPGDERDYEPKKDDLLKEEQVIQVTNLKAGIQIEKIPEVKKTEVKHIQEITHLTEAKPELRTDQKPLVRKTVEPAILADQFSDRSERFNETLAGMKHDDDLSEILKTQPLTNLSEAIGINDKFLFIREIFNGDTDSYHKAILRLDSAVNIDEARAVISGYAGDLDNNDAVKQLLDLLKRKFH